MTAIARAYRRFIVWVCSRPRQAALVLAIACLPCGAMAVQLFSNIQAGLEELLPAHSPSVAALRELHKRLGGKSHLTIIAHSPDAAANRRFIDALAERLSQRHIPEIRSLQSRVTSERAWLREHAALLMPREQFDEVVEDFERAARSAKANINPLYVDLEDDTDTPRDDWQKLQQRLDDELRASDRFPTGYLEMREGTIVVMLLWLQGSEVDMGPSERMMSAVKTEVAELLPSFPPEMRVDYTGEVSNLIEEHDAILADLSASTLIVMSLVGGLIMLYFRSPRSVLVVVLSLVPGLIAAFGFGRLLVDHLNSNTAFLGSIIAGNGINYPLLFLAYYRAQSRETTMVDAIICAAACALPGTLGAALTASAAYGGLAVSTFRGFAQFGWLGCVGMMTTWACTFIATPIAIALLKPNRRGTQTTRGQRYLLAFFAKRWLSGGVAVAIVIGALSLAGIGVRNAVKGGVYEMDIQVLRNQQSLRSGSASWDETMNELFGVWLNPVAALVDKPSDREQLATNARTILQQGDPPLAERVETIAQLMPDTEEQQARIDRLKRLEPDLERSLKRDLPDPVRELATNAIAVSKSRPLTIDDVPHSLRQGFEELDGRPDRVVLVYPSLRINYNDARNLLRFEQRLSEVTLPPHAVIGGGFLLMAAIIRVIRDEAPRVVLVVGGLVAMVLIPFFRRRPLRIPFVVLTVAAVALLSQAIMLGLGVRINMLNFAAVPITIGVGSDYVVNLLAAMDVLETDVRGACARMGGAILLCSLTTVVGYLSLVLAQSGALRTFGWSAVLGEIMAVASILVVAPAFSRAAKEA